MWVWEAGQTNPAELARRLRVNKCAWLAIKVHDGTGGYNSDGDIRAYRNAAKTNGLKFGVWGYLTGSDSSGEGRIAAQAVSHFGADFYIADAESGYEGQSSPGSSQAFASAFRSLTRIPALLSSFGRIDYHSINWQAWRDHGFDFAPQAYECDSSALTPAACVQAAEAIWPRERLYPTVGTYRGALGVLSGQHLYDSARNLPVPGVNIWDAQELYAGQLEALSHLVRATPPPRPRPPAPVHKLRFPLHASRNLKLSSPPTRGQDVKDLQQAINIWSKLHGGPSVAEDGVFGPLTDHAVGVTAYAEGLIDTHADKRVIEKIWHPWYRSPVEEERGKRRRAVKPPQQGLAAVVAAAAKFIGVEENPHGSNTGYPEPSGWEEHFGMNGQPWCGAFAGNMILQAGGHVTSRVVFCPYIVADAQSKTGGFDLWVPNHNQGVGPGWLVLYDWNGDGQADHVGVVEQIAGDHLVAIEGNTGGRDPAAGGMVDRVTRNYANTLGYARPRI